MLSAARYPRTRCRHASAYAGAPRRVAALVALATLLALIITMPRHAAAHGIAGDRVFPATIIIDDPAVGDEFSFPTFSTIHNSATSSGPGSRQFDYGLEWDKTITDDFGFSFNAGYTAMYFDGGGNAVGWQDPAFTLKYRAYVNAEHEFMTSVGLVRSFGGTGSSAVNDPIGSTTPTLYFGKGLGDLPVDFLRPFAVTGELQYQISDWPNSEANQWIIGASLQYSIPYLQQHVKDLGLPQFIGRMIPIVEVSLNVPSSSTSGGAMTGTIAPGILYEGDAWQLGVEALIPATKATNAGIGAIVQFHLYLDDIFPTSLGKPLFGK